jgi:hypothetical protein
MARKKKASAKASESKTSRSRGLKKAVPPPDNPLLRHEELDADRRIEGEETVVESASLTMAKAVAVGKRPQGSAKPGLASTTKRLADLRLTALEHSPPW